MVEAIFDCLGRDLTADDLFDDFVDEVVVGGDFTRNDRLAEPPRSVDGDL